MDDAIATRIRNLETKTGRSLAQWVKLVSRTNDRRHGEIMSELKEKYGLTHGYANLVAQATRGGLPVGEDDGNELVEAQYAGEKAALRRIYDRLTAELRKFGKDVELAPRKSYTSVRRARQFAILQPSTKTRFDVGINLKGVTPTERDRKSTRLNSSHGGISRMPSSA